MDSKENKFSVYSITNFIIQLTSNEMTRAIDEK